MPIYLAHKLARRMSVVRKAGELPWMRPDGKTQVTVEYHYGKPVRVDTVLVSSQHSPDVSHAEIRECIIEQSSCPPCPPNMMVAILRSLSTPPAGS